MSEYKIMFLRGEHNYPVGCLAIDMQSNPSGLNMIKYQVSTLNPSDSFDRPVARQLAIGRLVERPLEISIRAGNKLSFNEVLHAIMRDLISRKEVPNRSRAAAAKWLRSKPTI